MNKPIGDLHVVVSPLEESDRILRACWKGRPIETVGDETLEQFVLVPHVTTEEICPKCKAGLEKYEHEHGYRFVHHFAQKTVSVPDSIPIRPFNLVPGPLYE